VYVRVKSRIRAALDLISLASLAFFVALVAWHAWGVLRQSYVSGSRSLSAIETPLVVPQALWFLGLVFFVAIALLLLARALFALMTGDLDKLFDLIGSKSAVAEAKEEIVAVERAFEQERKP
jgi:TRAP-type mannitol/chloroaromatic compound transport system permease small subunit